MNEREFVPLVHFIGGKSMKPCIISANLKSNSEIRFVLKHVNRKIFFFGAWTAVEPAPQYNGISKILVGDEDDMKRFMDGLEKNNPDYENFQVQVLSKTFPDLYRSCLKIEMDYKEPY